MMPADMDGALSREQLSLERWQSLLATELSLFRQTAVEIDPRLSAIWTRGLLIKPIFVKKEIMLDSVGMPSTKGPTVSILSEITG